MRFILNILLVLMAITDIILNKRGGIHAAIYRVSS
jgi:hypothetical protein